MSNLAVEKIIRNLGGTWSLPPFRRAQTIDQMCIIVEFYGVAFYSIKMVIQLLYIFSHLPGHIQLTKLKFGDKSEPYTGIFTVIARKGRLYYVFACVS